MYSNISSHLMRQAIFILSVLLPSLLFAQTQASLEDAYARLQGNTLTVGNAQIERTFSWVDGQLQPLSLTDKRTGKVWDIAALAQPSPLFSGEVADHDLSINTVEETPIGYAHLAVEVRQTLANHEVRRIYKVYPQTPAIAGEVWMKRTDALAFDLPAQPVEAFTLPEGHYRAKAVEFTDRTDLNNNLVQERDVLLFTRPLELRGNLLFMQDYLDEKGLFLLKEAPCSFVQLHYPGHDFVASANEVQMVGTGVTESDLPLDAWIPLYSAVMGLGNDATDGQMNLRAYQKKIRRNLPERDEMIMMNTWGDRNKDASIGEDFIKKEVDACVEYGITHFQIDDGWQAGLSKNSASASGQLWDVWPKESWVPNPERFPNGFQAVADYAKEKGIALGLWFHPSNYNDYENWKQDAEIVAGLYQQYGIRYFKIDGIKLPTKQAELNLRRFFDHALEETDQQIVFNLDATADNRTGYHYLNHYGNIFLENRYSDWGIYYPHWTLRNLWMLSRYVPPEKLQIEFLNKWRNTDKYGNADPLAPINVPFEYQFALTMAAQPLAWFEGSNLPQEATGVIPIIKQYREVQHDLHSGTILPIGEEPDGTQWTGFQSVQEEKGYFLIYREWNQVGNVELETYLKPNSRVRLTPVLGDGKRFTAKVGEGGTLTFSLPKPHSFVMYRYDVL